MKNDLLKFFDIQRMIFGICSNCNEFFRLSDCKLFLKTKPSKDWKDELDAEADLLEALAEKLDERKKYLQELAREKGRTSANKLVKNLDPVFTPRKLNPDDAKVLFHPIDYIVFDGMKNLDSVKRIVLLDRDTPSKAHREIQRSIEQIVEKEHYEWITMRIDEEGKIKEEV